MTNKIKYYGDMPGVPKAIGPYSRATEFNNIFFLSGQTGVDPETGKLADGVEAQTIQIMKNFATTLENMGMSFNNVTKTGIFLTNISDFQLVNGLYEKALGGVKPARSTVQVAALPGGAVIEIDMIAVRY